MHVLLANEDEDDRLLVRDALVQVGARRVGFIESGQQLLDRLRRPLAAVNEDDSYVVLLDLHMRRMTAREVLAEIQADAALRAVPVVVLAEAPSPQDVLESYQLGAASFIAKPSTFAGLVEAMRTFHDYWAGLVNLPSRRR